MKPFKLKIRCELMSDDDKKYSKHFEDLDVFKYNGRDVIVCESITKTDGKTGKYYRYHTIHSVTKTAYPK